MAFQIVASNKLNYTKTSVNTYRFQIAMMRYVITIDMDLLNKLLNHKMCTQTQVQ